MIAGIIRWQMAHSGSTKWDAAASHSRTKGHVDSVSGGMWGGWDKSASGNSRSNHSYWKARGIVWVCSSRSGISARKKLELLEEFAG